MAPGAPLTQWASCDWSSNEPRRIQAGWSSFWSHPMRHFTKNHMPTANKPDMLHLKEWSPKSEADTVEVSAGMLVTFHCYLVLQMQGVKQIGHKTQNPNTLPCPFSTFEPLLIIAASAACKGISSSRPEHSAGVGRPNLKFLLDLLCSKIILLKFPQISYWPLNSYLQVPDQQVTSRKSCATTTV